MGAGIGSRRAPGSKICRHERPTRRLALSDPVLLNLFCAFNPFYNPHFNGLAGPCFSAPAGRGFSGRPVGRGFTSLLGFALAALLAGVLIQVTDYFGWVSYGDGAGWDVLNHY